MTQNGRAHIRVLMIDSELTWRGGEGQLALLMGGLVERSVEVTLAAAPEAAITRRAEQIGVRCTPVTIRSGMDLAAVGTLAGALRRRHFDVVHTHSSHAHSAAFMALQTLRLAGRNRPFLVVSRRVDFPVGRNAWSALKYRYGVDRYLAISNGVRDVLVAGGVRESRIDLVPSGIDLGKFEGMSATDYLYDEFGLARETPVVGNVAALAPHKSQVDFIRAAARVAEAVPAARFFIVGEGELRGKLEREARRLGLEERMTFTGFRRDALELLSIFDCFVLSSYLEGLCTSIMDAHALGVPVVATETGGVPDLVQDRRTGLLVPPRNPSKLADAIVEMLEDTRLRETCAATAKENSQNYDYNIMVDSTLQAYESLVTASPVVASAH